jgi:hypothetical protein
MQKELGELTYKMSFHNIYMKNYISQRGGCKANNLHRWDGMELAFSAYLISVDGIIECHL